MQETMQSVDRVTSMLDMIERRVMAERDKLDDLILLAAFLRDNCNDALECLQRARDAMSRNQ